MKLLPTPLAGVMLLETEPASDARGSFSRLSCVTTLAAHGVAFATRQTSLSRSVRRGTLRGLHYQRAPSEEPRSFGASPGRCSTSRWICGPDRRVIGMRFMSS